MNLLSSRFTLNDQVFDLLDLLYIGYGAGSDVSLVLVRLRRELGEKEYGRFESDLVLLMEKRSARMAVVYIALQTKQRMGAPRGLRGIYERA